MIILVDTREKDLHILKKFDALGIEYKRKKLQFGDYSFEIDGQSYENRICVERKGSLDEIIGNFTIGRERFRREFERAKGCKVYLMVESTIEQIERHQYRSKILPSELKSFLNTWCNKFQLKLDFVRKDQACDYILNLFGGVKNELTKT